MLGILSMRLGVLFIATRDLVAVGVPFGRLWLPSVLGASESPVHHRTLNGARFPSLFGEADRCSHQLRGTLDRHTEQSGATF
jgi:hypothetical protein